MSIRRKLREGAFRAYNSLADEDHQNLDRLARLSIRVGERVSRRVNTHRIESKAFADKQKAGLVNRAKTVVGLFASGKPKKKKR